MSMIAIGSLLVGAVLGLRYRIFVLFPVFFLGLATIAAVAMIVPLSVMQAALFAGIFVVALQLGFLCGLFARFTVAAARTRMPSRLPTSVVGN